MLSPTPILEHMPPKRSTQLPLILATDYWICTSSVISTGFLSSLLTIFNILMCFFFNISWGGCVFGDTLCFTYFQSQKPDNLCVAYS